MQAAGAESMPSSPKTVHTQRSELEIYTRLLNAAEAEEKEWSLLLPLRIQPTQTIVVNQTE